MRKNLLALLSLLVCAPVWAQKTQYKVLAIGSYNCENLFDTEDDPDKKDEDFTPGGAFSYTPAIYQQKLHNIATVIAEMGSDVTPDGPAVLGLVEIENDKVLTDLCTQPEIAGRHYKHVWFPTSDERGISTALLYNPKYFTLLQARPLKVPLESIGQSRPTRDILYVTGLLSGDTMHILVNHWPSKSGGSTSEQGRRLAAQVCKTLADSLNAATTAPKILLMGDLNDNPDCYGVRKILEAQPKKDKLKKGAIYNPWMSMHKKGMGTENYQGDWHMLDQIMLSEALISNENDKWKYYDARIFNKDFLINKLGKSKGLPHRSFTIAHVWDNGYSDHFPVLVYLISK